MKVDDTRSIESSKSLRTTDSEVPVHYSRSTRTVTSRPLRFHGGDRWNKYLNLQNIPVGGVASQSPEQAELGLKSTGKKS